MDTSTITSVLHDAVTVTLKLGGPILILNMLIGVIVAIFQAVTQIHEQSISFVLKLIVVIIICLLGGGWMMTTLQEYTKGLFALMQG